MYRAHLSSSLELYGSPRKYATVRFFFESVMRCDVRFVRLKVAGHWQSAAALPAAEPPGAGCTRCCTGMRLLRSAAAGVSACLSAAALVAAAATFATVTLPVAAAVSVPVPLAVVPLLAPSRVGFPPQRVAANGSSSTHGASEAPSGSLASQPQPQVELPLDLTAFDAYLPWEVCLC